MYLPFSRRSGAHARHESFTLTLGFCKFSLKKLLCLHRHAEMFAVEGDSVPLAIRIMDDVNKRRPGDEVSQSSVLDPGMLLRMPQLFVLGIGGKVQHAPWDNVLKALTTMRRSAHLHHLVNVACSYVPQKVAAAWERANQGAEGGLEPLDELQLSDALWSAFVEGMVRSSSSCLLGVGRRDGLVHRDLVPIPAP